MYVLIYTIKHWTQPHFTRIGRLYACIMSSIVFNCVNKYILHTSDCVGVRMEQVDYLEAEDPQGQ